MAWGDINVGSIPHVGSYADAERVYHDSYPTRNGTARRLIHGDRNKLIGWYQDTSTGVTSYSLSFGQELVTYRSDGNIRIAGDGHTVGDGQFASYLLPGPVEVIYKSPLGKVALIDGDAYRLGQGLTLRLRTDGGYKAVSKPPMWRWPRLDASLGRSALAKSRFRDFSLWASAVVALGGVSKPQGMDGVTTSMAHMRKRNALGLKHIAAALEREDRWQEIIRAYMISHPYRPKAAVKAAIDAARNAVYFESGALTVEEVSYIPRKDIKSYRRAALIHRDLI